MTTQEKNAIELLAAQIKHRMAIQESCLDAFVSFGLSVKKSEAIIEAIALNKIPNLKIVY